MEPPATYRYRNVILHGVLGMILLFGFCIAHALVDHHLLWILVIIPILFLGSTLWWTVVPVLEVGDDYVAFIPPKEGEFDELSPFKRRIEAEAIRSVRQEEGTWGTESYWVLACREREYRIPQSMIPETERDEVTRHLEWLVARS